MWCSGKYGQFGISADGLVDHKGEKQYDNISFQLVKSELFFAADLGREKKYSILGIFYIS